MSCLAEFSVSSETCCKFKNTFKLWMFFLNILMVNWYAYFILRHSTMNQEKLAKLQAQVRIGGKVRKRSEIYHVL